MPDRIEQIRCADIEVPDDRFRKDMGNLDGGRMLTLTIYGVPTGTWILFKSWVEQLRARENPHEQD